MAASPEQIGAVADFLSKLTLGKVALAVLFIVFGGLAYSSFENRQTLFQLIINSPVILGWGGAGVVMAGIGYVVTSLINRADELNNTRISDIMVSSKIQIEELKARIIAMEGELHMCRTECMKAAELAHRDMLTILQRMDHRRTGE